MNFFHEICRVNSQLGRRPRELRYQSKTTWYHLVPLCTKKEALINGPTYMSEKNTRWGIFMYGNSVPNILNNVLCKFGQRMSYSLYFTDQCGRPNLQISSFFIIKIWHLSCCMGAYVEISSTGHAQPCSARLTLDLGFSTSKANRNDDESKSSQ